MLSEFSELRVVLLTVLRSPHKVAMSIFMRGKGQFTYHDALDMTAVCLRRIQAIRESWPGEQALVRFDPRVYENDMRKAVRLCNLTWRDEAYRTVYVSGDRHYDPTRVEHPAQLAFDALSGLADPPGDRNVLDLAKDAALRERLIQSQVIRCALGSAQAKSQAKSDVAGLQDEIAALNRNLAATSKCARGSLLSVSASWNASRSRGAPPSRRSVRRLPWRRKRPEEGELNARTH